MKRRDWPARRDSRITSQYNPTNGEMLIGVARGYTGGGEVLYRIDAEKLAGALEDRKELAVIVNNLGLLVLAQLCGFNLAESLDDLPKAMAVWGHIDIKALKQDDAAGALRIAQRTLHQVHGHSCDPDGHAVECHCKCECEGTASQTICAEWCALCRAAALETDVK